MSWEDADMRRLNAKITLAGAGMSLGAWAMAGALTVATPALALPPASGSKCNSNWVNNSGAMSCFIQGEDESRAGVRHPHYVACVGGDVFCCKDDDRGNQDCVAQAGARPATNADWIKAILGAHRAMLTRMGRYAPAKAPPAQTSVANKPSDR